MLLVKTVRTLLRKRAWPNIMKRSKIPKNQAVPEGKNARNLENPDSIMQLHPSWNFNRIDKEGMWSFSEFNAGEDFWKIILPYLASIEGRTWSQILIEDKKRNHKIPVNELNPCAQRRLSELKLYSRAKIFSENSWYNSPLLRRIPRRSAEQIWIYFLRKPRFRKKFFSRSVVCARKAGVRGAQCSLFTER